MENGRKRPKNDKICFSLKPLQWLLPENFRGRQILNYIICPWVEIFWQSNSKSECGKNVTACFSSHNTQLDQGLSGVDGQCLKVSLDGIISFLKKWHRSPNGLKAAEWVRQNMHRSHVGMPWLVTIIIVVQNYFFFSLVLLCDLHSQRSIINY